MKPWMPTSWVLLVRIAPILIAGCPAAPDKVPTTPAAPVVDEEEAPDFQSAFKYRVRFDAGEQAVVVDMKIEDGYHAYTIGESTGRPLAVRMAPDGAYVLTGDVVYPEGIKKDLPIGPSVIVEGRAKIVAPVKKRPQAAGERATGLFQYQICTDEACDRPRKKPFDVKALPVPGP